MNEANYLTYENESVQINGFEELIGEFVLLRALTQGVTFEKWTQEDLTRIKFEPEVMNKTSVTEFFKEHNVFNTGYAKLNGVYYPVEDNSEFDETKTCPVVPIVDLLR